MFRRRSRLYLQRIRSHKRVRRRSSSGFPVLLSNRRPPEAESGSTTPESAGYWQCYPNDVADGDVGSILPKTLISETDILGTGRRCDNHQTDNRGEIRKSVASRTAPRTKTSAEIKMAPDDEKENGQKNIYVGRHFPFRDGVRPRFQVRRYSDARR